MRVWVDCTAAAHPLVLRPIVERLRERGHEVEITAREYGQTVGILERLGLEHTVVGAPRRRLDGRARRGALAGAERRARRWARGAASTWRSATARSTSRWSRIAAAGPVGPDAGLRARRPPAPARVSRRSPRAGARRDPGRGDAPGRGARERKLVRYPGLKEDYYLADFEPDRAVLAELGLDDEPRAGGRAPAAGVVGLPRRQPALRRRARPPGRRRRARRRS